MSVNFNLNNSLSPIATVVQVEAFAEEGDVCPFCHTNDLVSIKGKILKLIAHLGHLNHVMHAKCLRILNKSMLHQNPNLPVGFLKCLHCQLTLDPTGINNEVFETKIPKGLFARTLKFASNKWQEHKKELKIGLATYPPYIAGNYAIYEYAVPQLIDAVLDKDYTTLLIKNTITIILILILGEVMSVCSKFLREKI